MHALLSMPQSSRMNTTCGFTTHMTHATTKKWELLLTGYSDDGSGDDNGTGDDNGDDGGSHGHDNNGKGDSDGDHNDGGNREEDINW